MFKRLMKSDALRTRTSLLLAVISIPSLLFFFHMATQRAPGREVAGSLFGKTVTWETLAPHIEWVIRQVRAQAGQDLPLEILEPIAVQQAWERLMLIQEAERQRLRVPDQELAAHIRRLTIFQQQGQFDVRRYDRLLAENRLTRKAFEAQIGGDLLIRKLYDAVTAPVAVAE